MNDNSREYSRITARNLFERALLPIAFALLLFSQAAVALMFFRAHELNLYPFGSPSGVNGVGHWEEDGLKSLLAKSALSVALGAVCALVALCKSEGNWRALVAVALSVACALVLAGITLVMFCD